MRPARRLGEGRVPRKPGENLLFGSRDWLIWLFPPHK